MSEYSLIILTLYLFTLCNVFIARFLDIKIGNILAVATALTAFGVAAFRPEYFPDMDTYPLMFDFAASGDFNNLAYWFSHGEPGFKILQYLISLTGLGFFSLLVIMAAFSILLLFYISRLSGVPFAYLWFTYFSFTFLLRDLGTIRLAIALHLILIFYLHRSIIWQAVALITASLSFQYFAFVAMLAKPLSRFNINWLSLSLLLLITFLGERFLSFENLQFLIAQEGQDLMTRSREGGGENAKHFGAGGQEIILPIVRNLFFAFFLYFLLKNESKLQHVRLLIWAAFLSGTVYIMASDILIIAQRFSAYFAAVIPLAMAYVMQRRSIRNDAFFLTVLVSLLNFASLFYYYGPGFRFF